MSPPELDSRRLRMVAHVIDRAWERYGVRLSYLDIGSINARIQRGEGFRFKIKQGYVGVFILVEDQFLPFAVDTKLGTVSTVLPPNAPQVLRGMMETVMHARLQRTA